MRIGMISNDDVELKNDKFLRRSVNNLQVANRWQYDGVDNIGQYWTT
jgi:hypothetical protein